MASIDITTQSGAVGNGDLQLQNGAPMDATLRFVTDAVNTASPLKLSTSLVQTTSTLKITTNDNPYIDAEDGSGNNRFTVGRAPASQQVNVDFASNPAGSTTAVGAIRTFRDGTNLSEAMTFIEDGSVGIGTTVPVGLLDLYKAAAATRLAIRGDAGQNRLISYRTGALQRFGLYVNNTAESGSNAGSNFAIRAYNDAGTLLSTPLFIERSTGNVGLGTTTPATVLDVVGSDFMIFANNSAGNRVVKIGVQPGVGEPAIQATLSNGVARQLSLNPSGGNVGIGTTAPNSLLEVSAGTTIYPINITSSNASLTTTGISMGSFVGLPGGSNGSVYIASAHNHGSTAESDMVFYTHTGSALTEKGRFLSIGGLTFNGDTAAANALDDYEEGTWTMGIAFNNSSTGVVYAANIGTYTKIGRQVTVTGFLILTNKGTSVGGATITGLPFTVTNNNSFYSSVSLRLANISFIDQFQGYAAINTTTIELEQVTSLGVTTSLLNTDFANNSNMIVNLTYFV